MDNSNRLAPETRIFNRQFGTGTIIGEHGNEAYLVNFDKEFNPETNENETCYIIDRNCLYLIKEYVKVSELKPEQKFILNINGERKIMIMTEKLSEYPNKIVCKEYCDRNRPVSGFYCESIHVPVNLVVSALED